jgi:hypothetical protein
MRLVLLSSAPTEQTRLGSASFCNQDIRSVLCNDEQYEGKSPRDVEAGNIFRETERR